jgi:hypothetical protein
LSTKSKGEVVFVAGRSKDQAPEPVNFTETLGTEYCAFPVLYKVSGKMNIIEQPNGDRLYKYPALRLTLTNKETGKQVTHVTTGTVRASDLEGGETLLVTTGQTVINSPNTGILVLKGRYTFVEDEDGNFSQPEGNGRIIDACVQLA